MILPRITKALTCLVHLPSVQLCPMCRKLARARSPKGVSMWKKGAEDAWGFQNKYRNFLSLQYYTALSTLVIDECCFRFYNIWACMCDVKCFCQSVHLFQCILNGKCTVYFASCHCLVNLDIHNTFPLIQLCSIQCLMLIILPNEIIYLLLFTFYMAADFMLLNLPV